MPLQSRLLFSQVSMESTIALKEFSTHTLMPPENLLISMSTFSFTLNTVNILWSTKTVDRLRTNLIVISVLDHRESLTPYVAHNCVRFDWKWLAFKTVLCDGLSVVKNSHFCVLCT